MFYKYFYFLSIVSSSVKTVAPRAVLPTGFRVEEGVGPRQLEGPGETQGGTVGHHQTIPQPPTTLTQHSSGVLARFLCQKGNTQS